MARIALNDAVLDAANKYIDAAASGVGLTDTQLRATAVPVSGTVSTGGLTDTQLRATAVPVSLATSETVLGQTATPGDIITVTPTLDTVAYATGDILFNPTTITNAVRANGNRAILQSIALIDKDDQKLSFDLFLLEANNSLGTINTAPSISDANAEALIHVATVAATDWIDMGGVAVATPTIKNVMAEAAGGSRDLFIAAIARGAPTHTASGIVIRVGLVQF